MIIRTLIVGMFILLTALPASAQLDRLFKSLGGDEKGGGLSDVKIGSGLKEALAGWHWECRQFNRKDGRVLPESGDQDSDAGEA